MRSRGLLVGVVATISVLAWALLSLFPGLIFLAAFADSRNQMCLQFPDAGNCSDALGTMLVTGGILAAIGLSVALVARWLVRQAAAGDGA